METLFVFIVFYRKFYNYLDESCKMFAKPLVEVLLCKYFFFFTCILYLFLRFNVSN